MLAVDAEDSAGSTATATKSVKMDTARRAGHQGLPTLTVLDGPTFDPGAGKGNPMASATYAVLDVPFADKDRVKALGARWDHRLRRWYVPAGIDTAPFAAWRPRSLPELPGGPTVCAKVILMPETCYRCEAPTTSVAGLLVDPSVGGDADGFISFGEVAGYLVQLLPRDLLGSMGVGEIRWRRSSVRPEGYLANGCRSCGTIMGDFYLEEALCEYLAEGGDYETIAWTTVQFPVAAIPKWGWEDDDEAEDTELSY